SVSERAFDKRGMAFVRENANAPQRVKISFEDPHSPTHRRITAPREGEMEIGAREMKMLPVQVQITGGRLCYTTAEVLAHGHNWDRAFLILYDEPGRAAEISFATEDEPKMVGETTYRYWDQDYESAVFGVRFDKKETMLLYNESILIILVPRSRALRTWIAEFPTSVVLGSGVETYEEEEQGKKKEKKPEDMPFITDGYRMVETGSHGYHFWADLEYLPGEHDLFTLLPSAPSKCHVDGALTDFQYDRDWRSLRLHLTTPPLPVTPLDLPEGRAWVEKFETGSGDWLTSPARALEDLGAVPYGYVKYRAQFAAGSPKMFIKTFMDDFKKVFINGKLVAEASNAKKEVEFGLSAYAAAGATTLEISYEAFGAYNGGKELGDLKGIESVRLGSDAQSAKPIESWQIQRVPAPMRGREVDPAFGAKSWQPASYKPFGSSGGLVPAFAWYRTEFTLPGVPGEWVVPWKLVFEADRDALLYLNGKFLGRYSILGPQKEFYLPEPFLASGGSRNVLTFVLAYTDHPGHVRTLRAAPYEEFSVRRTRVEFEY
ncbi:MAG: beta galactosidase jelly roll domain-containing protein, partial [Acidobacteriia bacterium]|nr:beta galactosidase jelly roll domain-containing protein [Terriglobia bacterium]